MILNPFEESARFFASPLQQFQYLDKYSRFSNELGRRETWIETVDRAVSFLRELSDNRLDADVYDHIKFNILNLKNMPSMRLLASAGPSARRNNQTIYNCSAVGLDSIESIAEILTLSMAGCGVGFSVERKFVSKLPVVLPQKGFGIRHVVADSTEGWAAALKVCLEMLYKGYDVEFDYSNIRPAGSILRIKGGQASGPKPLMDLLSLVKDIFFNAQGRQLTTLEVHDIACEIGTASISGGNRRTSEISLFDKDDELMLSAKNGLYHSRRHNANNSLVWTEEPTKIEFDTWFGALVDGHNGEPGLFSRYNMRLNKPARRQDHEFLTNPCAEISLLYAGLCNLSIAVARVEDTSASLRDKVEVATIIGTIQSLATNFTGLRSVWKDNAEFERLLGTDITGQADSPVARKPEVQRMLRGHAIEVNKYYAKKLGIPQSAAVTTVKPSGNSAVLLDCSSGIHARWSDYYVRNVRISAYSPLYKVLRDSAVPMNPENGQTVQDANTWVIPFPVKSPDGATTRHNVSAIQQCNYWLQTKQNWAEHNVSVTISYKAHEVEALHDWLWKEKNNIGGMSFLPNDGGNYEQMPFQEIDKNEYARRIAEFPKIDFSQITKYEQYDTTTAASEIACVGGLCDVI